MTEQVYKTLLEISAIICQTVPTERIYLFGSYAYGTPTEDSDFDIYVVLPDDAGIRQIDALHQIRTALYKAKYHMPMDILANYLSRFDDRSQALTLERTVATKGILLYGRPTPIQRMA